MTRWKSLFALALLALLGAPAGAQDYPKRPITLVLPFPPGGSTSIVAPLDDRGLLEKFHGLVAPVLGDKPAAELSARLWTIEHIGDVIALIEAMAKPKM